MDEPVQPLALSYAVGAGDTAASLAEKTATGSIFGEVCPHNRNLVTHVTSLCSACVGVGHVSVRVITKDPGSRSDLGSCGLMHALSSRCLSDRSMFSLQYEECTR